MKLAGDSDVAGMGGMPANLGKNLEDQNRLQCRNATHGATHSVPPRVFVGVA